MKRLIWIFGVVFSLGNINNAIAQNITSGNLHSLYVCEGNSLNGWGFNAMGQLGLGDLTARPDPLAIATSNTVTQVASGIFHSVILTSDSMVYSFGRNVYGQIGTGSTGGNIDTLYNNSITGAIYVEAGSETSGAIKSDGTVWQWGRNGGGQIGTGNLTDQTTPSMLNGVSNATQISCGLDHTLILTADSTVWAIGSNVFGQLGDGTTNNQDSLPIQLSGLAGIVQVSAGNYFSTAVAVDGTVYTWGATDKGQIGRSSTNFDTPQPVSIGNVIKVSAANSSCLALTKAGEVWSWGENAQGQLGQGTSGGNVTSPTITVVFGSDLVRDIEMGGTNGIAVLLDTTLVSWGLNNSGLGDIDTTTSSLNNYVVVNSGCTVLDNGLVIDTTTPPAPTLTPYNGVPHPVPGLVEAEQFGEGGEGVAFHDLNPNSGGEPNLSGVDIEACSEGGDNVGWIEDGEWLKYVVDVTEIGFGSVDFRIASESTGGSMRITFDNQGIDDTVGFAATGGWQNWATETINNLDFTVLGPDTMTIYMTSGGFNFNYIDITITADSIDNIAESLVNLDKVYPNPFKDKITVDLEEKATVSISNITGAKLFIQNMSKGSQIIDFNNQGIDESGLYFIQLNFENRIETYKLIKK